MRYRTACFAVSTVQNSLIALVKDVQHYQQATRSYSFPAMKREERQFVHELAVSWRVPWQMCLLHHVNNHPCSLSRHEQRNTFAELLPDGHELAGPGAAAQRRRHRQTVSASSSSSSWLIGLICSSSNYAVSLQWRERSAGSSAAADRHFVVDSRDAHGHGRTPQDEERRHPEDRAGTALRRHVRSTKTLWSVVCRVRRMIGYSTAIPMQYA